ncbi:MAG: hypothetical protein MHMPM18_003744 [Marteilia pararefringens]
MNAGNSIAAEEILLAMHHNRRVVHGFDLYSEQRARQALGHAICQIVEQQAHFGHRANAAVNNESSSSFSRCIMWSEKSFESE